MIERGLNGQIDERRCLKEQMSGKDGEQWHGLLQKKRVTTGSIGEDS